MIVFVPDTVARIVAAWQKSLPDGEWTVERRGLFRTIVRAAVIHDGRTLVLEPVTSGELSAELRARSDDAELHDALSAFRVSGDGPVEVLGGWLRKSDPSPVLRGLALCALVARVEAEDEDYAGVEDEPGRLLDWLTGHGAEIALSEEEREWLAAAIGALPEEARYASLPDRCASHAFALGLVADPEPGNLPELMSRFGFLSEQLPAGLRAARIQKGREQFLG